MKDVKTAAIKKLLRWSWLGILLMVVMSILPFPVLGSESAVPLGNQWSRPQRIPGYGNDAQPPLMVADRERTVHAFGSLQFGDVLGIAYSKWTPNSGWTLPNDILLSPLKSQARLIGVHLDDVGIVHLVFFGGDDQSAGIFYTTVPVKEAGSANAWSELQVLADDAITPTNGDLVGDGKGNLYLLYSGNRDGLGLYGVYSTNGGNSWTEPALVQAVPDDQHSFYPVQLALDEEFGRLHAAWTMVNFQGNGDAIYYAHMSLEDNRWSEPVILARRDPGDYEVDWASTISYNGELFIIYQDSSPATRWMIRSIDGGDTWSEPVRPFDFVGEYRYASLVIDSDNYLHMLLGNRTNSQTHGMWHSVWLGDHWSDLEAVIAGPRIISGPLISRFDPNEPRAIVSQGNVLLVTWLTDPGAGPNGVWYSYTVLNTTELPVEPFNTPTPLPTLTSTPTQEGLAGTPEPTPRPTLDPSLRRRSLALSSPAVSMTAAALPVVLLLTGAVIYYRKKFKP